MTTATLSVSRIKTRIQNRIDSVALPQVNWKAICITGLILCSILLVFYIYQVIGLTKGTYLINSYDNQLSSISKENRDLELNFAESNFLAEVLVKMQGLSFQRATEVSYIQILNTSEVLAKKDNMR